MGSESVLTWIKKVLSSETLAVADLSEAWNDGVLFCEVVNCLAPDAGLCTPTDDRKSNILLAFEKAEEVLGFAPCAETAEDIIATDPVPEESVLSFLYALADELSPTLDEFELGDPSSASSSKRAAARERRTYSSASRRSPSPYRCKGVSESVLLEQQRASLPEAPCTLNSGQGLCATLRDDAFAEDDTLAANIQEKHDQQCEDRDEQPTKPDSGIGETEGSPVLMARGDESSSDVAVASSVDEKEARTAVSEKDDDQDASSRKAETTASDQTVESVTGKETDKPAHGVVDSSVDEKEARTAVSEKDDDQDASSRKAETTASDQTVESVTGKETDKPAHGVVDSSVDEKEARTAVSEKDDDQDASSRKAETTASDQTVESVTGKETDKPAHGVVDSSVDEKEARTAVSEKDGDQDASSRKAETTASDQTVESVTGKETDKPAHCVVDTENIDGASDQVHAQSREDGEPAADLVSSTCSKKAQTATEDKPPESSTEHTPSASTLDVHVKSGTPNKPARKSSTSPLRSTFDAGHPLNIAAAMITKPSTIASGQPADTSSSCNTGVKSERSAPGSADTSDTGGELTDTATPQEAGAKKKLPPSASMRKKNRAPNPVVPKPEDLDAAIRPHESVPEGCCNMCGERIFEIEKLELEGVAIHRKCLRCHICKKPLQMQTYEVFSNRFTCSHHYRMMRLRIQASVAQADSGAVQSLETSQSFCQDIQKLKDEMNIRGGSRRKRTAPLPPKAGVVLAQRSTSLVTEAEIALVAEKKENSMQRRSTKKKRAPLPPKQRSTTVFYVAPSEDESISESAPTSLSMDPAPAATPAAPVNRRMKPKAPPAPDVCRRHRQHIVDECELSMSELNAKLEQLDRDQRVLEEVAAEVEDRLSSTSSFAEQHAGLVKKLNVLKSKKKALVADENFYVYQRMDLELINERTHLEGLIQELMSKDEADKTDEDRAHEEALVNELVAVVEERNRLLTCLEEDPDEDTEVAGEKGAASKMDKAKAKKELKEKKEREKRLEKERKEKAKQELKEQKEREKLAKKGEAPLPNVWKSSAK
ncbi:F-actin-monooxygenase mical2b-like [Sycon ciliatum]|uniref:F-actin-monooxygenase mical2b-like n=1 Tax=Sycon ciliatum TaxID=27933 RepID=UPI0031F6C03E